MRVLDKPIADIIYPETVQMGEFELQKIEDAARACYSSKRKDGMDGPDYDFIKRIRDAGHTAMLEFGIMCVKFTVDRALAQQITRHRLASYAMTSTLHGPQWKPEEFELTVIRPGDIADHQYDDWLETLKFLEESYRGARFSGMFVRNARSILPMCTACTLYMQANFTEWRHVMKVRTGPGAHPDMQELMKSLIQQAVVLAPVVFDDLLHP